MAPFRQDERVRRAGPARWRRCVAVAGLCLLCAACSATTRFEVLSFFFNGVPDPSKPRLLELYGPPVPPIIRAGRRADRPLEVWHVHEPYQRRLCAECHKDRPARKTGFGFHLQDLTALRAPIEEVCVRCHKPPARKFKHAPARLGQCTLCHHPHMSPNARLLLQPESKTLCLTCHDEDTFMTRAKHAAYGSRGCHVCHDPHASDDRLFLRADWQKFAHPPPEVQGPPLPPRRGGRRR